jgi:DNA helicase IV
MQGKARHLETVAAETVLDKPGDLKGDMDRPDEATFRDALMRMSLKRQHDLDIGDQPLVFGRIDLIDGRTFYIGRQGVSDEDHETLVVDWRAPIAQAFYRATPRSPLEVVRRRHFIFRRGELTSIEDEVLNEAGLQDRDFVLMGEAALLRSIEKPRTGRMGDIVETIQAEQDVVIRSPLRGIQVVQGGPGTGKTVVGLHRAAYLLYTHRRELTGTGVLVIGPHPVFLRYIEDVLPSLGEQGVQLSTPADLILGGGSHPEDPPRVARIKSDPRMAELLERAVALHEKPLGETLTVFYEDQAVMLGPEVTERLIEKFKGMQGLHNQKRSRLRKLLIGELYNRYKVSAESNPWKSTKKDFESTIGRSGPLRKAIQYMWPTLTPRQVLANLYSDEELLAGAADGVLESDEYKLLIRHSGKWSRSDGPLIDHISTLLGKSRKPQKRKKIDTEEVWNVHRVLDSMEEASGKLDPVMRRDLEQRLLDERMQSEEPVPEERSEDLGHVIVDEAQTLDPLQWSTISRRCAKPSMTILGDLGQEGGGWGPSSWDDLVPYLPEGSELTLHQLTINYRTPAEFMDTASAFLAEFSPGVDPPISVREIGHGPDFLKVTEGKLEDAVVRFVQRDKAAIPQGRVAVVAPSRIFQDLTRAIGQERRTDRLSEHAAVYGADEVRGLEFDAVIAVEPSEILEESGTGALYVVLTRATQAMTIVHEGSLPRGLSS